MGTPHVTDRDCNEVVILIHGTGAGQPSDAGDRWWQLGSEFAGHLEARLGPGIQVTPDVFHWTGKNSEAARRGAGHRLLKRMKRLEAEGVRYHLVGHSHGGMVIWNALRRAAARREELPNLRSWTTVGTPFLRFIPDPVFAQLVTQWTRSILGLLLSGFVVWWFLLRADGQSDGESGLELTAVFCMAALALWAVSFSFLTAYLLIRGLLHLWTVGKHQIDDRAEARACDAFLPRWTGLCARYDEAVGALQNSVLLDAEIIARRSYVGVAGALVRMVRRVAARRRVLGSILGFIRKFLGWIPRIAWWPIVFLIGVGLVRGIMALIESNIWSVASAASGWVLFVLLVAPPVILAILTYVTMRVAAQDAATREEVGLSEFEAENSVTAASELPLPDRDTERVFFGQVIGMLWSDVYALIYNHVVAPIMDDFIWTKLTHTAQGNDRTGYVVCAVSGTPVSGLEGPLCPPDIDEELLQTADVEAADSVSKIRKTLTESVFGNKELWKAFSDELTYRELVHNGYFHSETLREHIFGRIAEASAGRVWPVERAASVFRSEGEVRATARKRATAKTRMIFLLIVPLLIAAGVFSILVVVATAVVASGVT